LLGVRPFEDNLDVIEHAADQRMTHLRTFQSGRNAQLSQRLLNEVAAVRVCLLDKAAKTAYDQELRRRIGQPTAIPPEPKAPPAKPKPPKPPPTQPAPPPTQLTPPPTQLTPPPTQPTPPPEPPPVGGIVPPIETRPSSSGLPPSDAPSEEKSRGKVAVVVGAGVAGMVILLAAALVVWGFASRGTPPPEDAVLVFDWSENELSEVELFIDEREVSLRRGAGPPQYQCKPGEHRVSALRQGFKTFEEAVVVKAGDRKNISPVWLPQTHLILLWPAKERRKAELRIDGTVRHISSREIRSSAVRVKVPLDPGSHAVRIERLEFKPFEQEVTIVEGEDLTVKPTWEKQPDGIESPPGGDNVVKKHPEGPDPPPPPPDLGGESLLAPVPSPDAQQQYAEKIDERYKPGQATTASQKIELARKLAELGRQAGDSPAERYMLLRKAAELARDGGDAALMLSVIDTLGLGFDVDKLTIKDEFLTEYAGSATNAETVDSVVDHAMSVIEQAVAEDRYETALHVAETAQLAAVQFPKGESSRRIKDRHAELKKLHQRWQEFQKALTALKTSPGSTQANGIAGRWYCFHKGDWKQGLPYLAQSSDERLMALAQRELKETPSDVSEQIKLADAWWNLAEATADETKHALALRAGSWYERALPNVSSAMDRDQLTKRLREITDLGLSIEPATSTKPEALELQPGDPLSEMALVVQPAVIEGLRSWTMETSAHRGGVRAVAFSPLGRTLATGGEDGTIRFWVPSSGKFIRALVGHDHSVNSVAFSPDGKTLASGAADMKIHVWDVDSGLAQYTLRGHSAPVTSVAFSSDGQILASAGGGETVCLWDVASGQRLRVLDQSKVGDVRTVAWSPNGNTLATGGHDASIRLWDASTGQQLHGLTMDETKGNAALAFLPNGKTLATSRCGPVYLWDVTTGKLAGKLATSVHRFVCNPDGNTLLVVGERFDPKMRFWDIKTGTLVREQDKPKGLLEIWAMAYSRKGDMFAAASPNGVQLVRKTRAGMVPQILPSHTGKVVSAAFSPKGNALACGNRNWTARIWDVRSGRLLGEFRPAHGPDSYVHLVSWSPNSQVLATNVPHGFGGSSHPNKIHLWDVKSGRLLREWEAGGSAIAWYPDGRTFAFGGGEVHFWDPLSGKAVRVVNTAGHAVAWSPDGKTLGIRGCDVDEVKVYDPRTDSVVRVIKTPRSERWRAAVAFSPDGKALATGIQGNGLCVCDVGKGLVSLKLEGRHQSPVTSLRWLDKGKMLASGSKTEICIWDIAAGKLVRMISDDGGAFSHDGQLVACRGPSTIRLRSLEDGQLIRTILSLRNQRSLVIQPDGGCQDLREAEEELVFVVQTDQGQQTVTPADFEKKYRSTDD